jgi:hypothetical protein
MAESSRVGSGGLRATLVAAAIAGAAVQSPSALAAEKPKADAAGAKAATRPAAPSAPVRLTADTVVEFAAIDAARDVVTRSDVFVKAMSPFDRQSRMKIDHDVSEKEYLEFEAKQVLDWSADERARFTEALVKVSERFRPWKLPLPKRVLFIKTTGEEEAGAAYCREQAVAFSRRIVANNSGEGLEKLITHELFHILSRNAPQLREKLYGCVGFTNCGVVELPADLSARKITNPDAPTVEHAIELSVEGQVVQFAPMLIAKVDKYDAKGRRDFFQLMDFRLVAIEKGKSGAMQAKLRDGKPWLVDPHEMEGYFDKIGRNTGYIIHPEEIVADNFVLMIWGQKDVKSPQVLDGIRKLFEAPPAK